MTQIQRSSVWALAHRVETWYERGSVALNRIGQLGKWSTAGAIIIRRAKESNTWPSFLLFPIANCMRRKISRLVPQRTVFWRWTFRHQPSTTHKKYSRNSFQSLSVTVPTLPTISRARLFWWLTTPQPATRWLYHVNLLSFLPKMFFGGMLARNVSSSAAVRWRTNAARERPATLPA